MRLNTTPLYIHKYKRAERRLIELLPGRQKSPTSVRHQMWTHLVHLPNSLHQNLVSNNRSSPPDKVFSCDLILLKGNHHKLVGFRIHNQPINKSHTLYYLHPQHLPRYSIIGEQHLNHDFCNLKLELNGMRRRQDADADAVLCVKVCTKRLHVKTLKQVTCQPLRSYGPTYSTKTCLKSLVQRTQLLRLRGRKMRLEQRHQLPE